MIFAPTLRRTTLVAAPRNRDVALQRFLLSTAQASAPAPSVQVQEDGQHTTLQLDVPGLAREQLAVRIDGNSVHLNSVDGAPRRVQRAWELPHEIDAARSSAKLEHGVLTLALAKRAVQDTAVSLAID